MHKLFVGNLSCGVTLQDLTSLLQQYKLHYIDVQFKDNIGAAFVDFPDQNCADKAIDALSGLEFHGSILKTEPTMPRKPGVLSSSKIQIRQIPSDVDWKDLAELISRLGTVIDCEHAGTSEQPTAIVTYSTKEAANETVNKLNDSLYCGNRLKVSFYMERNNNNRFQQRRNRAPVNGGGGDNYGQQGVRDGSYIPGGGGGGGGPGGGGGRGNPGADMPLRMVVDARFVGAIIGQGGSNIREITKESKARCVVDVQRGIRDQSGNVEKVINVYGQPDNCSRASMKILEVVQREAEKDEGGAPEPELKLRAHNQLVGRLIGKAGQTIKKIMEDTGCTIFVSNDSGMISESVRGQDSYQMNAYQTPFYHSISELNAFNMERTITIRGAMENIATAQDIISNKLRACWEHDMMNAANVYGGGMHPLMSQPMSAGGGPGMPPFANASPAVPYNVGAPVQGLYNQRGPAEQAMTEVVHMWVPNNIVGALIGTKGVHIRNVMRLTGAHIRIEGGSSGGRVEEADRQQNEERLVTITGTDTQQYKAQFWIYQRVCENAYHFFDEVRLCTEVSVPTKLVGRIIGKGGQNVRELQRLTGAQVKIPEDAASEESEETIVRVIGNFNASQAVQARIRQLMHQYHMQQARSE